MLVSPGQSKAIVAGESPLTHSVLDRARQRWKALTAFKRHWLTNIALGILIEIFVHVGGHTFHWGPIVNFQNWGLDVVTRLNATACTWLATDAQIVDQGNPVLRCPQVEKASIVPILVDVDAQTWRDPEWGGGEPYRAPRDKLLALIERSFKLGAKQVVLDVVIEDAAPADPEQPKREGFGKWAAQEDQMFADGLRTLLQKGLGAASNESNLSADRKLILVRTVRNPLPFQSDTDAFLGELRGSAAVDAVVAQSGGRIVVAAPYFQESADRITRDWDLFKVVCERLPGATDRGVLRAVPSVQLASLVHRADVAARPNAPSQLCVPYPQFNPSTLPDGDSYAQACLHNVAVEGSVESIRGEMCKKAKQVCGAAKSTPDYDNFKVCPVLLDRLDAIDADAPRGLRALWEFGFGQKKQDGFVSQYWSGIQTFKLDDGKLGDLPQQGGLGNRIVFRHTTDQVKVAASTISAKRLLSDPGAHSFAGRTVVIGQTYQETGDFFRTPLGSMPGAVVLINAIDSMSRHQLMQPPSSLQTLTLALILIVVVGFVFARWDSAVGATIAVIGVVLTAGVASFFYFAHGVWFDFAAPIFGIHLHRRIAAMEERIELKRLKLLQGEHH